MKVKRNKGFFSISAVAKMFSVHQQTIRLYEKQGLITPERSSGNTRLFSEENIERLEEIIYLTHELGINLAGVEMVLKLKKQVHKMQKEMNDMFEKTQKHLDEQAFSSQRSIEEHAKRLMRLKKESLPAPAPDYADTEPKTEQNPVKSKKAEPQSRKPDNKKPENKETDNSTISWEVEYEE